jgi:predicted amidohydrolase YtcJ
MKQAETIYVNGTIRTMNPESPQVECVAVSGGMILHAGLKQECQSLISEETETFDLAGKTMLPGFSDNHLHLLGYGISLIVVNLSGLTSIEQVVEKVRKRAAEIRSGEWVIGRGWDQNEYIENRFFDRHDLDRASKDHPIIMSRICGHAAVVNSRALELAMIDRHTPNPGSGVIEKDIITGEPNGILHEDAINLVSDGVPRYTFDDLKSALGKAMVEAIKAGVTSVTTDDVNAAGGLEECIRLYQSQWDDGKPAVRAYLLVAGKYLDEALAKGYRTGWGDERVKVGPLKLFQDGSLGARTAALMDPYTDQPDTRGILVHSQEDFNQTIAKAHRAGMQIGVHAIGDAAILSTLESLALAQNDSPRADSRHRIIHYEVITPSILEKSKELGIIADIQPKFLTTDGSWLEKRLGQDRSVYACAWRTILDAGIPAVGGSDCPVEPLDPLLGIHAAVTRTVYSNPGISWNPAEKLTIEEATALFTRDGAFGSFEEAIKGTIQPGRLADFVILDSDPWQVDPDRLDKIQVAATIIDGKLCYSAE